MTLLRQASWIIAILFFGNTLKAADVIFTCAADGIGDQDDMCIWLHPVEPSQSLIITADKDTRKLFVYNLAGEALATHNLPHKPGNIDLIYNFPLDGELVDIVGFNTRSVNNARFGFFKIDKETLELDSIGYPHTNNWSDELYGFALYHSPNNNAFYAFGSDQSSLIQQYQFLDDGAGGIALEHKRTWQNGSSSNPTEGMVADQETGLLYAANENQGIFVYQADEDQSAEHIRMIGLSTGMLDDDVEGVTIYYAADGQGYLLASSQGENYFSVFERAADNAFVGLFRISGVGDTDGIDVSNAAFNSTFSGGVFACHNDRKEPHPVELISWLDIADDLMPGLTVDTTFWDPRNSTTTAVQEAVLDQNSVNVFPNPTRDQAEITFVLSESAVVRCDIFDASGSHVTTLSNDSYPAGKSKLIWDQTNISGLKGLVFCHLMVGEVSTVQKIVLL